MQNGRVSADIDELRRLRRARDRMDREYAQPLDVPALARTALMSPAHFSRRFREAYSETPYSYLMTRRIERAKALLRRGDLSVTDVCFAVGCTSLGSFSARFTEIVGETPSAYRARNHDELRVVPPVPDDGADPAAQAPRAEARRREQFRRSIRRRHRPSIGAMTTSLSTVHILVDDPDAALAFYRDTLGLTVRYEVAKRRLPLDHPRHRQPTRRSGSCCRSRTRAAPRRTVTPSPRCSPRVSCTRSISAPTTSTRPSRRSPPRPASKSCTEPASQPWGVRDAAVRDPAGNRLRIEQG